MSSTGVVMDGGMSNQWSSRSSMPSTPPSVMSTRWWMLCSPNVAMAVPNMMSRMRLNVSVSGIFRNMSWTLAHGMDITSLADANQR